MGYRLIYIIKEESTNNIEFTIRRDEDGKLADISYSKLLECLDEIANVEMQENKLVYLDNVKKISVYNRKNTGGKLVKGLNDLYTYCMKNNKKEWLDFYNNADNEFDAEEITYSSNKIVKIKCTHCNHERELMLTTFINTQAYACIACQSTYHSKCMTGVNDFYTMCKKNKQECLLEEYDGKGDLTKIGYRSHCKDTWRCKYGHSWLATFDKRASGRGCPYCKGAQTSKTERAICNWLKENNISIIERDKIQGQEFDINIIDYNILIEFNSDATHCSPEYREKDLLKREIAKSLGKKLIVVMQNCYALFDDTLYYDILFKADEKMYIEKLIDNIKSKLEEHGLNIENNISLSAKAKANKNEVPFERSLLGVYTDIKEYWSDKNEVGPELIFAKARRYVYLKCNKHNNEYCVRADSLVYTYKNNRGCVYCEGKLPVKGENDLLTLEPELCRDWNDSEINPDEVTLHSNKVVNWKCQFCGHEWRAMINNRTGVNKTGCPNCRQCIVKDKDLLNTFDF